MQGLELSTTKTGQSAVKCNDLENRIRRNNIRLYGIPEGAAKDDMEVFVTDFLYNSLQLKDGIDIKLETAHRALGPKPKDADAALRSIIVRFLDFKVKQSILQQAWKQRDAPEPGGIRSILIRTIQLRCRGKVRRCER